MEKITENNFNVWEHFNEWEGWTCKYCNELIESSERTLINHLNKCKEKNKNGTERL